MKDYHYYHKKATIYSYIALTLMLLAVTPLLFHFNVMSKDITGFIQLGLGLTAFTFYFISAIARNKRDDIRIAERRQKKKEEFNKILKFVEDHHYRDAIAALYDYDNKYN